MSDMDKVLEQITVLTNQIKENGGTGGLDRDALVADLTKMLDVHKAAILDELPMRPGEANFSPAMQRAVTGYQGKYQREVRDIAERGEHKIGNWRLRAADLFMAKLLLDKANKAKSDGFVFNGSDKVRSASDDLTNAVKALTSTGVGTGDELVPTNMAAELWQDFFAASRVAADLPTQPMPSDPFDLPYLGEFTFRKGGQGAAPSSQNPTTAKSQLASTEQVAEVDWTYNLDEDSIIAMMPALRQLLTIAGAEQMDAFALNADATATASANINLIDGTPAADAYYLSDGQDGIRHQWLVDNTGQGVSGGGDALADADMIGGLNKLGKYGISIEQVRIVPGIESYFAMLGLTNVATVDKYGPQATIVRGELARYRGVPILPSSSMLKANSAGKIPAAGGTLGAISMYNRLMWYLGSRRGLLIEVDRDIVKRQLIMVVSFREAIGCRGTRASAAHTSGVYNFTL